ncbi:MAG: hypothetical protein JW885_14495 [Deltaproteobacteria bacterium]|nr:hypothetical protein [Candidatus Zymogenaceae bacterium]
MKRNIHVTALIIVFSLFLWTHLAGQEIYKNYDENGVPVYTDTGTGDPHEVFMNTTPLSNIPPDDYAEPEDTSHEAERNIYDFLSIETLLKEAERCYTEGEFEEAAEIYTYVLKRTDDTSLYPFIYYSRGNCYYSIVINTIFKFSDDIKLKNEGKITDMEFQQRNIEREWVIHENEIKSYNDLAMACYLGEPRGCDILEIYPFK